MWWLRYRPFDDFAQDAHSLPLQTLAELGLVGVALLGPSSPDSGSPARNANTIAPALAAGPIAVLVTRAHAPLDWDWQMPAVTLVAIVLGRGAARAGRRGSQSSSAIRGASRRKIQTANTHTAA